MERKKRISDPRYILLSQVWDAEAQIVEALKSRSQHSPDLLYRTFTVSGTNGTVDVILIKTLRKGTDRLNRRIQATDLDGITLGEEETIVCEGHFYETSEGGIGRKRLEGNQYLWATNQEGMKSEINVASKSTARIFVAVYDPKLMCYAYDSHGTPSDGVYQFKDKKNPQKALLALFELN
jgi:hypothetical protein